MGFIKDVTGSFSLALVPLVALSAVAALVIIVMGRTTTVAALPADSAAVLSE